MAKMCMLKGISLELHHFGGSKVIPVFQSSVYRLPIFSPSRSHFLRAATGDALWMPYVATYIATPLSPLLFDFYKPEVSNGVDVAVSATQVYTCDHVCM